MIDMKYLFPGIKISKSHDVTTLDIFKFEKSDDYKTVIGYT